jgi:hypothetical protein
MAVQGPARARRKGWPPRRRPQDAPDIEGSRPNLYAYVFNDPVSFVDPDGRRAGRSGTEFFAYCYPCVGTRMICVGKQADLEKMWGMCLNCKPAFGIPYLWYCPCFP